MVWGAGLPWWFKWLRVCLQCGRPGFNPWVGKIPWRRKWQPTLVFLPGKSHGWRSLVGYTGHGVAKSWTQLSDFTHSGEKWQVNTEAASLLSEITGVRQQSQAAFHGVGPGNLQLASCTDALLVPRSCTAPLLLSFFYGASAGVALGLSRAAWVCCCCSVARPCLTLCDPMDCSTPGFPVLHSWSLLKLMSIASVMPSNHLILCLPLLLLPSVFPSIRVSSNKSVLCMWPKYWGVSFRISPSKEYSGLISFRIDWIDLLAVQRTLKSLLQHHSLKASILQCSAFFMVQLSHPYMTTGKTTALTIWTLVGKVISLVFNTLFRFFIDFCSRSKCLNFTVVVTIRSDFGAQENKICHCFHVFPSICYEVMGLGAMILVF